MEWTSQIQLAILKAEGGSLRGLPPGQDLAGRLGRTAFEHRLRQTGDRGQPLRLDRRRNPQPVAVAGEDAQQRGRAGDRVEDFPRRCPRPARPEVVLAEQVAEDEAGQLSSRCRMNSASSPAASRPRRWKVRPRARAGRRGKVRLDRYASQAD